MKDIDDLHRVLNESQVGMRALLTVLRGSEKVEVAIVPEAAPSA